MICKKSLTISVVLAFTLVSILALIWFVSPAQAGPGLPPREQPPSNQEGNNNDSSSDSGGPVGAHIELHVQPAHGQLWAAVQWEDSTGTWNDVEGWRGELDPDGTQRWWVAPKDFGTGPFQWIILSGPNGKLLTASSPFYLPTLANDVVQVAVTME